MLTRCCRTATATEIFLSINNTKIHQVKPWAKYGGRSPKFIWAPCHVMCTAVLIGWGPPSPRICTRITRALLVSKDRQHLFITPLVKLIKKWGIKKPSNIRQGLSFFLEVKFNFFKYYLSKKKNSNEESCVVIWIYRKFSSSSGLVREIRILGLCLKDLGKTLFFLLHVIWILSPCLRDFLNFIFRDFCPHIVLGSTKSSIRFLIAKELSIPRPLFHINWSVHNDPYGTFLTISCWRGRGFCSCH